MLELALALVLTLLLALLQALRSRSLRSCWWWHFAQAGAPLALALLRVHELVPALLLALLLTLLLALLLALELRYYWRLHWHSRSRCVCVGTAADCSHCS